MIRELLIGTLIFAFVTTGLFSIMEDANDRFGLSNTTNEEFDLIYFNQTSNLQQQTNETWSRLQGTSFSAVTALYAVVAVGYNSMILMAKSLPASYVIITEIAAFIGIPPLFITTLMTIITVCIIFAIIYTFFRRN